MDSYSVDNLEITVDKLGSRVFAKVSYPIRYGRFSEIQTPEYVFQFNLNGEIKFIQGRTESWPDPAEWLKRTVAHDWVYYSTDHYRRVFDCLGEYYIPNLDYPSNAVLGGLQFRQPWLLAALRAWRELGPLLASAADGRTPERIRAFLELAARNDDETLKRKAQRLHELIGGAVTVLPPDTRHVDYDLIPVVLADGCLYNCPFCCVKDGRPYTPRPRSNIEEQIRGLKDLYARDLPNYNSVFLAGHDALHAGREQLTFAARSAYEAFDLAHSNLTNAYLFMFGSADSVLEADDDLFESLNRLPYQTFINLGLESADPATLSILGKPLTAERVGAAFDRMLDVNARYDRIEVTANFVYGGKLPPTHIPSILKLISDRLERSHSKGAVYLSPLKEAEQMDRKRKRELVEAFRAVRPRSRLPMFLYLIQRL